MIQKNIKNILKTVTLSSLMFASTSAIAVPPVTGSPVVVKHIGSVDWPQETPTTTPFLTQGDANALNDMHGDVSCDVNISTPGNYHMALRDAMYGRADLGHEGLVEQVATQFDATVCWTTSPPINEEQIPVESVQFKNVDLVGRPALAMGPGKKMNNLVAKGLVDESTRQLFMRNRGNVILMRADKSKRIKGICDLANDVRLVTPNPPGSSAAEGGSFGNFSGTLYNVIANDASLSCHDDADEVFNDIFSQDITKIKTENLSNTFNHEQLLDVYKDRNVRWVSSSRIMHRDIPYALCNNYADAGIIFYHQAIYLKKTMATLGCNLEILPLGGTEEAPQPVAGNKIGALHIAKVSGTFSDKVSGARDLIYDFITASPIWTQIMDDHGMDDPTP